MDYRELLKKYMNLIGEEEGAFYLFGLSEGDMGFTNQDIDELNTIALELNTEAGHL